MQPLAVLAGAIVLALLALGLLLALTDRIPDRPGWLRRGFTRRRRGVIVEYPPGLARLAGISLLLYAVGIFLIADNIITTFSGGVVPRWSAYGGWPLLLGILLSLYVMLALRRPV